MSIFSNTTLSSKALGRVLPVALLVLGATWFVAHQVTVKAAWSEVSQRLDLEATQLARQLNAKLGNITDAVVAVATNDLVINSLQDTVERDNYIQTYFQSLRVSGSLGGHIGLFDYKGRVIATNRNDNQFELKPEWIEMVMSGETLHSLDEHGLVIAAPVMLLGSPEGFILLNFQDDELEAVLAVSGHTSTVLVLDDSGRVNYSSSSKYRFEQTPNLEKDHKIIHAKADVEAGVPLRLMTLTPLSTATKTVNLFQAIMLIAIAFSVIALLGGILGVIMLTTRPLKEFITSISQIGETGNLTTRVTSSGTVEFERLASAFNRTMERLEEVTTSRGELQREIEEREKAQRILASRTEELQRSNAELEQFAYVASHDLQEPLRMVGNFTELLRKRYSGRLDDNADRYISFAVDGATRMQVLLKDLLQYSRLGTHVEPFTDVDTAAVCEQATDNLRLRIGETGADIQVGNLPVVHGDEIQLVRVFQNLISNAIKFCGENTPMLKISAHQNGTDQVFSIEDNGIGIEEKYRQKIFVLFQRLHARSEYPGTGIGLAVCDKIIRRHGGRIWVESNAAGGSTFYFSIGKVPAKSPDEQPDPNPQSILQAT